MRQFFFVTISIVLFCTSIGIAEDNALSEVEKRCGWKLLFDGNSTEGWRNFRQDKVSDGWKVVDGTIKRVGRAGDIMTVDQYDNFELSIEYKISKGGNSGIMFHVTEEENTPWKTGPEIQVQDNIDGHDPQKAGWLYQLYKPVKPRWALNLEKKAGLTASAIDDSTRPAGEWNHVYLRIDKKQCEVAMNGVSYYYFNKGNKDWDNRVAKSKFSKFKNFGKASKGFICLQDHGNEVAYRNIKIRELPADGTAPEPVDGELDLKIVPAFPKLKWEGWTGIDEERGRQVSMKPIVLTHANDDSNRNFVATQSGVIHVFENDPNVEQTKIFLDLSKQVAPWRKGMEEGFLGLTFHPKFKENGFFYVLYNTTDKPQTEYLSRFKVSNDPNKADADSEVVLMKIDQPFPNHNGGSILFGDDGYLYLALGDGGGRNDPFHHGQNLKTLMGSILRIDVNKESEGKKYSIPADNPFVGQKDALPEIYAYGVRNIWRMAKDRANGKIWIADVGQDLYEEINILEKGGNYGWSVRESAHGFGNQKYASTTKFVEPIWEYDHRVGKSITGGFVYRGTSVPELKGHYLYADYVTGRLWALDFDHEEMKVKKNFRIPSKSRAVISYGEDQNGEVYFFQETVSGKDIYKFSK